MARNGVTINLPAIIESVAIKIKRFLQERVLAAVSPWGLEL